METLEAREGCEPEKEQRGMMLDSPARSKINGRGTVVDSSLMRKNALFLLGKYGKGNKMGSVGQTASTGAPGLMEDV